MKYIFILSIFYIPSIYLFINYTTSNEFNAAMSFLMGGFALTYFELNKNKLYMREFIDKYI